MTAAALRRTFFALPILGWIARDIAHKGQENIWYALLTFVSLVAIATILWGLPALSLSALAMVPVMMALLVRIAAG
ncbi:hypothetical protein U879_19350 [Defluviimonas sp. 20V17]|uniref:Uncharacterized protein n=1 Tax=Allgaiera indica TaxID=765699 RepID=A0AAN5A0C7_9RHOB|nr:hypothetical protein [Allgaiera indica]KDB02083.1 hypothetical protein U879_19350 [Defluviimonas sp. 20V17]GHE03170.1 hypothetical protein GCM10008024_25490 [Allgaiera indica]SDX10209.1 hypothetical protein SAMN05444006_11014 [Allgaiera indica]